MVLTQKECKIKQYIKIGQFVNENPRGKMDKDFIGILHKIIFQEWSLVLLHVIDIWRSFLVACYSMFFLECNITWWHNLKSERENWILKKVPKSWWWCILSYVTPRTFLQKSVPSEKWQNVVQNQQKTLLF